MQCPSSIEHLTLTSQGYPLMKSEIIHHSLGLTRSSSSWEMGLPMTLRGQHLWQRAPSLCYHGALGVRPDLGGSRWHVSTGSAPFQSCHWVTLGSLFINLEMDASRIVRKCQEQSGGVSCSWKYARCWHSLKSPPSWFHSHLGSTLCPAARSMHVWGWPGLSIEPRLPPPGCSNQNSNAVLLPFSSLPVTCLFTSLLHWATWSPCCLFPEIKPRALSPGLCMRVFPWHIGHLNPPSCCPTQAWVLSSSQPPCVSCSQIVTHQALGLLHQ